MKATIAPLEIAVRHTIRPDVGREFIAFEITGWDDVKKLAKKVLLFDGRKFIFSCWNSDRMECIFFRPLQGEILTAKIVAK